MIKLAGGRGSAEAAAAVTQLPFRLGDCQLGLSSTITVRRAQRHCRDFTEEREKTDRRRGRWVRGCEKKMRKKIWLQERRNDWQISRWERSNKALLRFKSSVWNSENMQKGMFIKLGHNNPSLPPLVDWHLSFLTAFFAWLHLIFSRELSGPAQLMRWGMDFWVTHCGYWKWESQLKKKGGEYKRERPPVTEPIMRQVGGCQEEITWVRSRGWWQQSGQAWSDRCNEILLSLRLWCIPFSSPQTAHVTVYAASSLCENWFKNCVFLATLSGSIGMAMLFGWLCFLVKCLCWIAIGWIAI